jgi:hypothetical protein
MAETLNNNLSHFIKELTIVTKVGNFDISDKFEELNIFDNIFCPCMTGIILITDAIDLTSKFNFDGSDLLKISIGKNENVAASFTKTFKIYKKGKTIPLNSSSEQYALYFVSEEYYTSKTKKIKKVYDQRTFSDIVSEILTSDLLIQYGYKIEQTVGLIKYPSNNRTPFDCILDITKKAISLEDQSPSFVFFENRNGFNFVSLSNIAKQLPVATINYEPKMFEGETRDNSYTGARYMEIVSQFDIQKNIDSGVYGSTGVFVDIHARQVLTKETGPISFNSKSTQLNKTPDLAPIPQAVNPNLCTRVYYGPTVIGSQNSWTKENDPTSINTIDDTTKYFTERPALMRNYTSKRIKLVMPGNFNLACGTVIDLLVSSRAQNMESDSKDESISGKYIVLACRNVITYQKHETILEVSTDSTNKKQLYRPVGV